jgi:threonylcarbamoyladenosine tRNA methylthiotransferase MtaB
MRPTYTTAPQTTPKRAAIHTLGCRLNHAETQSIAEQLIAAGYILVPFDAPADLGILHTCTVTHAADAKSRKMLRGFIRRNPGALTAVIGCSAQMQANSYAAIPGVSLIIGNEEKLNLLDYLPDTPTEVPRIVKNRMDKADFTLPSAGTAPLLSCRANLKIQDGCDFMCSFCIIPFARGRARSRALPDLLAEAHRLTARGAKEIILTGVNIGTYAWEGKSLLHIIEALNRLPDLQRIRISSIEPGTIPPDLLAWMADPRHKLVPHLHVPVQSGSNTILAAMRRRYSREVILDLLHDAAERVPDIGIGTDIIVGFPGETENDFDATATLLREAPVAFGHLFLYSTRAGTAAARLPNRVPPTVAHERSRQLHALLAEKTRRFQERHLGTTQEVLFDTATDHGAFEGYTRNYLRVRSDSPGIQRNTLVNIRLHAIADARMLGTSPTPLPHGGVEHPSPRA